MKIQISVKKINNNRQLFVAASLAPSPPPPFQRYHNERSSDFPQSLYSKKPNGNTKGIKNLFFFRHSKGSGQGNCEKKMLGIYKYFAI